MTGYAGVTNVLVSFLEKIMAFISNVLNFVRPHNHDNAVNEISCDRSVKKINVARSQNGSSRQGQYITVILIAIFLVSFLFICTLNTSENISADYLR